MLLEPTLLFTLYLKGIHLTLDNMHPQWGADGWKKLNDIHLHIDPDANVAYAQYSSTPPLHVTGVP